MTVTCRCSQMWSNPHLAASPELDGKYKQVRLEYVGISDNTLSSASILSSAATVRLSDKTAGIMNLSERCSYRFEVGFFRSLHTDFHSILKLIT